jgi:small-conductance mechanosensitive channel
VTGIPRVALWVLLIVVGACDVGSDGPASDSPQSSDTATAETTGSEPLAPASGLSSGDEPDSVEAGSGAVSSVPGSAVDASDAGVGSPQSDSVAPLPVSAQELESILARLDQIVLAQAALAARLDSLAGLGDAGQVEEATAPGEVLGQAGERVRSFGVGIVWAILVLAFFNYLIHGLVWVLDTLSERSVARRLFFKKLVPVTRILLWVFAAYLIVRVIFQVDAQGLLAAAAAVGVAVGFAAQDLLKNLFGGIILVFDQPFQAGDKISVGGTYGEVVSIGLRSTRIVTPDDSLVSVPNAQVVDGQVANANAGELNCQVVTDLYLPGWVDEARAKRIAFEAAASSKYVYLNKPIVVLVKDEFKETFLTHLKVKAYVLDPRFEFAFQSDVTERARAGFRDAGLLRKEHGLRAYLDMSQVEAVTAGGPGAEGEGG